ncbi:hypothetical protein DBR32_08405 [Taibaiella sp. KBW10]|uniref:hypothetical protein n=1 Tax=Taibaiella sp. KBW10 TaxID=2153357 RepID=UPI000F59BFC5|nr:hypothetical protein [Taibaiella sp. KBW10]RQO30741.1 hypothetical protein DBR32_08405 [Taibaiella sp. KBW10]
MKKTITAFLLLFIAATGIYAQDKKITSANLPEYIIITANNNSLIGGIAITIDKKNSVYHDQLDALETQLESKKTGAGVRNLSDLLNTMSDLGYEYVNAFQSSATETSYGKEATYAAEQNRNNIVFRKKK